MENDFDVMMIGNFAKDKLITDGVEQVASGGGVYYGSVVIRRLGLNVAVVTRLHPDDFPRLEELKEAGVVVYATPAEGTSGIANYYRSNDMECRDCIPIGFGGHYEPDNIPEIHPKVILVTPLFEGEIDLDLLEVLSRRAPIGLDIQGFVRVVQDDRLVFQPWQQISEGLELITYLKVDRAEAECLTGLTDIRQAALKLAEMGPKEIVLTQSSCITVYAEGIFYEAAFNPRSLVGRTGRGDTCFSTYIARRLNDSAENACQWAGVITSLKQEKAGPWNGSVAEVETILLNKGRI
ncbi:MAG: PfkB family carbohydrate kinase [Anaerolineaceae bacterium]